MDKLNNSPITLFWFRRDLRLNDNTGLYAALNQHTHVQPIFIFDTNILDDLDRPTDKRISFIYEHIEKLKIQLQELGSDLWVFYGKPIVIFQKLIAENNIKAVYTNTDYEPYANQRDSSITAFYQESNIPFYSLKDQVVFEKLEIAKDNGTSYTVFSPFMRKWKIVFAEKGMVINDLQPLYANFNKSCEIVPLFDLEEMGFKKSQHQIGSPDFPSEIIKNYNLTRDFMAIDGTSRLSVHLRFGTISIRELVKMASVTNETYFNELIWREFYMQILWNFPHVVTRSFKPQYDNIPWNRSESDFQKWCTGNTGYPIVDAAMHQLLQTGFMHNRARMLVASFLTKHLLIDWRKGESYFAKHLTDYELSSNNGGWQWAASSGCDAVPYFRIFNPESQTLKFDPQGDYIKKWGGEQGLKPIIEHKQARERCLATFKKALSS